MARSRFDRMSEACNERRLRTDGLCEEEDCCGIGWCAHCYAAVPQSARRRAACDGGGEVGPDGEGRDR